MAKRKIGRDYKISVKFWNKIKPLLSLPKPKKKLGRPRKDDKIIMSGILSIPIERRENKKQIPQSFGFNAGLATNSEIVIKTRYGL